MMMIRRREKKEDLTLLSVESAPFVIIRWPVIFFFLKVSPVEQKTASSDHCNCKLFICDLVITKVIKKSLRRIFNQACSVFNIEKSKITDYDNGGSDYE